MNVHSIVPLLKAVRLKERRNQKLYSFQKQRRRVKTRANNRLASVRTKVTY